MRPQGCRKRDRLQRDNQSSRPKQKQPAELDSLHNEQYTTADTQPHIHKDRYTITIDKSRKNYFICVYYGDIEKKKGIYTPPHPYNPSGKGGAETKGDTRQFRKSPFFIFIFWITTGKGRFLDHGTEKEAENTRRTGGGIAAHGGKGWT